MQGFFCLDGGIKGESRKSVKTDRGRWGGLKLNIKERVEGRVLSQGGASESKREGKDEGKVERRGRDKKE